MSASVEAEYVVGVLALRAASIVLGIEQNFPLARRAGMCRINAITLILLLFALIPLGGLPESYAGDFVPSAALRTVQEIERSEFGATASFYSSYEKHSTTINNRMNASVVFRSYAGYVARVEPRDLFSVPCHGERISGQIFIVVRDTEIRVEESTLCGDLILLRQEGGRDVSLE